MRSVSPSPLRGFGEPLQQQRPLGVSPSPVAQFGIGIAIGGDSGEISGERDVPVFHSTVARSTRFVTTLPARVLLHHCAALWGRQPHPLPPPFSRLRQTVRVHEDLHRLELLWGGGVVTTLQVYLAAAAPANGGGGPRYVVDFYRGSLLNVFAFQRLYEDLRAQLSDAVRHDASLAALISSGAGV